MTALIVRLCCVLSLLLAAALPARAATAPKPQDSWDVPMKIVIVRSSEKGCEPTCPEWIMAEGRIEKETPGLLLQAYAKAKARGSVKLPLIIRSPGGNILAALQMGYFVRAQGIDVAVGTTGYEGCSPFGKSCKPNADADGVFRGRVSGGKSFCLSACPLVLAGGQRRLALPTAVVGVHRWGYETPADAKPQKKKKAKAESGEETAEDKFVRRMIGDYLAAIGNSEGLLADMNKAPFSSIYLIKPKRRAALALVTAQEAPTLFTAASLCADDPVAASCITSGLTKDYREGLSRVMVREGDAAMSVTLVRDARTACEPVCGEFIALRGVIRPDTPKRVAKLLAQTGKRKLPIVIDSAGGDADAAIEIGRMIAKRGLNVAVGTFSYIGCPPGDAACDTARAKGVERGLLSPSGTGCRGSCVLVLAAGTSRLVAPSGDVALYRAALLLSRAEPAKSAGRIAAYLKAIKQDKLLARMTAETSDLAIPLTGAESLSLALATDATGLDESLPSGACTTKPRPSSCVKR